MKGSIVIILVFSYSNLKTDSRELLKENIVDVRQQEQIPKRSSVSLFDFLIMHYFASDFNENDNIEDIRQPIIWPCIFIADNAHDFIVMHSTSVAL